MSIVLIHGIDDFQVGFIAVNFFTGNFQSFESRLIDLIQRVIVSANKSASLGLSLQIKLVGRTNVFTNVDRNLQQLLQQDGSNPHDVGGFPGSTGREHDCFFFQTIFIAKVSVFT